MHMDKTFISNSFLSWVKIYDPDFVSRRILSELLYKYQNGDKLTLFEKFKQLIDNEHYTLAAIFRNCLIYIGINDEFKIWLNYNNGKIKNSSSK